MNISPNNGRNFMKKLIASLAILAVIVGGTQKVSAGEREWATAGKVLTGVVAGAVIARSFEPVTVYASPPPVVYTPPPAAICVTPAPVYVAPPVVTFGIGFGGRYHHRWPHRIW